MSNLNLNATNRPRAFGDYLAERFHQREPRSHVTRTRKRDVLAVTQVRSHTPMAAPSRSMAYEEAYHVCLMIESLPDLELWQDGRSVKIEPFKAGTTGIFDLRRDPRGFHRTGYNILPFYLPRAVLIDIAQQKDLRFTGELQYTFGSSYDDPIIRNLGSALLIGLEREHRVDGLLLDHILHALGSHVVERYGASALMDWAPRCQIAKASAEAGTATSLKADHEGEAVARCAPYMQVLEGTADAVEQHDNKQHFADSENAVQLTNGACPQYKVAIAQRMPDV